MSAMLGYPADLKPDDNGTLLATSPKAVTSGEDEADAVLRAVDAPMWRVVRHDIAGPHT